MAPPKLRAVKAAQPCPSWQVSKGHKMTITSSGPRLGTLELRGSAAELKVSPRERGWNVQWKIEHYNGRVEGHVHMDDSALRRAFGLEDGLGTFGATLADRTGTPIDAAEQGQFVRWGEFLNIPHPGTGLQGDPNISIELSDEIRTAVQDLLQYYSRTS